MSVFQTVNTGSTFYNLQHHKQMGLCNADTSIKQKTKHVFHKILG